MSQPHLCCLFVGQSQLVANDLHTLLLTHAQVIFGAPANRSTPAMNFVFARNQRTGLQLTRSHTPQFIFLQIGERNGDRQQFSATIRERLPYAKILGVGRQRPESSVGFDAFLSLPFNSRAVVSALQLLHRIKNSPLVEFGPFRLNQATHLLSTPRGEHHLRPKELALLHLLLEHKDNVVTRSNIMLSVWDTTFTADTRTLDVHISQLRRYLEEEPSVPRYLITKRGEGYILRTNG
jgi:two-component system KDP operon response regulator KdpE